RRRRSWCTITAMVARLERKTQDKSPRAGRSGVPVNVAVVPEAKQLTSTQVARVVDAIQKQLDRDVRPAWNVTASVKAFGKVEEVPVGHWPVIIRDEIEAGAQSFHSDQKGTPYGMVAFTDGWSKAISHTVMEMLIDPHGNRMTMGPSP